MPRERAVNDEETEPLTRDDISARNSEDASRDSVSSVSTTSLVLEHINDGATNSASRVQAGEKYRDDDGAEPERMRERFDLEDGSFQGFKPVDKKARRLLWLLGAICVLGWVLALVGFLANGFYKHGSTHPHDPLASSTRGSGRKVTLDSVLNGQWYAARKSISWIAGPKGEDGLLLETGVSGKDFLVVENVRSESDANAAGSKTTLMKKRTFEVNGQFIYPSNVWPSKDFKKVLVISDEQRNWRHSFTGKYWIFDVETQTGQPLDPENPGSIVQLASWSPQSDAVVFTRNNNMFLRKLGSDRAVQITEDGGTELFYGVPDWVYEEEVFAGNSATWWSEDGQYIAFLRTDESTVPTFPVQYFLSRPSGRKPKPGEDAYPEVRNIKYPKAGAPNPIVTLQFYDVSKGEVFDVKIENDFVDDNRLITEIVWAGKGKVLVRETNRESDVLKIILMDVERRTGKTVRTEDVFSLDGGWMEVSQKTTFVPADPANGRSHDGYIDTVIHEGYDHIGYFHPLDNAEPTLLTKGDWEVVDAPSRVDLDNNLVYYISTERSSMERHAYSVKLDGTNKREIMEDSDAGYYDASFSSGGGYALVSYNGPGIPWQKIISTPSSNSKFAKSIEENKALEKAAREHELPILNYQTVEVDGFKLNVVERRPPHFNPKHKYPVLFYQYSGPMSQTVDKQFKVDFQSYIASSLGYIVVSVDGRGTGFLGRKHRCIVRGDIGAYEAKDQIAVAKLWSKKKYVDQEKMAIWGWSYGAFMALKTLETDAGNTFKYGMAVAPVTDWRFYGKTFPPLALYCSQPLIHDRLHLHRALHAYATK
jgi:dipeptidyl aminopeptidase